MFSRVGGLRISRWLNFPFALWRSRKSRKFLERRRGEHCATDWSWQPHFASRPPRYDSSFQYCRRNAAWWKGRKDCSKCGSGRDCFPGGPRNRQWINCYVGIGQRKVCSLNKENKKINDPITSETITVESGKLSKAGLSFAKEFSYILMTKIFHK